ncbi:unnamed protein product [Orchesella dallaii]
MQCKMYNFLERPRGTKAVIYHLLIFVLVFGCFGLSVFSTIKKFEDQASEALFYMEIVVVTCFTTEFVLRLWSAGCRSRYQGAMGRLRFFRRPFCIIDTITIGASLIVLADGSSGKVFATSAIRGLRFFQILRMVRVDRRGGTWKLLGSVVWAHRQELITTLYIGFLGLILSSFLVYLAEKDEKGTKFTNYAESLWWGVITLCTVGYGDIAPETWMGKLIASFCALMGISFFALPAGILGSGFALKVQQQQRQKHMIRRRQPAATLIQCLWRCYAADENSCSIATWKIHLTPLPSPPASKVLPFPKGPHEDSVKSFKHNASFVMTRWPTIRRHKSLRPPSPSPSLQAKEARGSNRGDNENTGTCQLPIHGHPVPPKLQASTSQDSMGRDENSLHDMCEEEEGAGGRWQELTPKHKAAIRAIRKMKYLVSRRKFREALKPYDVKDVIEQYSAGHVDLLSRVKSLQSRLDMILGRQGSKARDVYDSKICLAARIVKVERQVEDIESKIEQLLEMYTEDRKRLMTLLPSTSPGGSPPAPSGESRGGMELSATGPCAASSLSSSTQTIANPTSIPAKPRPILIGKQYSEPNSPVTRLAFHNPSLDENGDQNPSKMRKRVTLSSIPSRETTPQSEEPLREMDHLVVPEAADPHVHLFLNACSGCEDDVEHGVFQANEISTNLGKAGPNGIFEGEFADREEENAV